MDVAARVRQSLLHSSNCWKGPRMATRVIHQIQRKSGFTFSLALLALALMAGCQSHQPSMVENLPPPNFNGPDIQAQAPVVAQLPQVAPRTPVKPAPAIAAVPREWIPPRGAEH